MARKAGGLGLGLAFRVRLSGLQVFAVGDIKGQNMGSKKIKGDDTPLETDISLSLLGSSSTNPGR